jgi:hypothetical protein
MSAFYEIEGTIRLRKCSEVSLLISNLEEMVDGGPGSSWKSRPTTPTSSG